MDAEDVTSDAGSWDTDGDLAEQVEAVALHDQYLEPDPLFDSGDYLDDSEPVQLPVKRRRIDDRH